MKDKDDVRNVGKEQEGKRHCIKSLFKKPRNGHTGVFQTTGGGGSQPYPVRP